MRFRLTWASVSYYSRENLEKLDLVKKAGFKTEHHKAEKEYKCYVYVDTIEELKKLDEVTGKHGLVIRWEGSPLLEYPKIDVYDDYME